MMKRMLWLTIAVLTLFLPACSDVQVRVDYDQKEDFARLHTYAWAPPTESERQAKAKNSLMHERIQAAIDAHLTARGYVQGPVAQADFLITHSVAVERRTQINDTRMTVGYGRYGAHGGVGMSTGFPIGTTIDQYKVGTLIIDVIDAKQQRLVWRGAGDRTIGDDYTPEKRTEIINSVVNEILGRFPPTNKKTQ